MKTIENFAIELSDKEVPKITNDYTNGLKTGIEFGVEKGVQFAETFISVTEELPEPEKRVIIQVEFGANKNIWRTMACYIPFKTVKEEDFMAEEFEGDGDYDEETDTYYTPEGWYETNLYSDINYHISDKVIGWRPINRK